MKKHTRCLVCNSEALEKIPRYYAKHNLVRCTTCRLVFIELIPNEETLTAHYSQYSYSSEIYYSPSTRKSYQALLNEFEKHRQSNRILDIGCGRGWFLLEAQKRGWEVYGTEYSEAAVKICRRNGIDVKHGRLHPSMFSSDFDVITSFEVLEHVNNPNESLSDIRTLLRPGGLLYCTTPNFNSIIRHVTGPDYSVIAYPEHLCYYTKTSLNFLARQNGFAPTKFLSTGLSITRLHVRKSSQTDHALCAGSSSDEKLRQGIDSKWYLGVAKTLANRMLTTLNAGMTLKAYYIKT